jgi:hypothetical protein
LVTSRFKFVAIDIGSPEGDSTVEAEWRDGKLVSYNHLRGGKSEMMRRHVEKALNDGKTVIDGRTGEARGANVAKDITPKPLPRSRQIEHK